MEYGLGFGVQGRDHLGGICRHLQGGARPGVTTQLKTCLKITRHNNKKNNRTIFAVILMASGPD